MSHSLNVYDRDDELVAIIKGNSDFSGDVEIMYVEGEADGGSKSNHMMKSVTLPGEILKLVAEFIAKEGLRERLIKFLEEA